MRWREFRLDLLEPLKKQIRDENLKECKIDELDLCLA